MQRHRAGNADGRPGRKNALKQGRTEAGLRSSGKGVKCAHVPLTSIILVPLLAWGSTAVGPCFSAPTPPRGKPPGLCPPAAPPGLGRLRAAGAAGRRARTGPRRGRLGGTEEDGWGRGLRYSGRGVGKRGKAAATRGRWASVWVKGSAWQVPLHRGLRRPCGARGKGRRHGRARRPLTGHNTTCMARSAVSR